MHSNQQLWLAWAAGQIDDDAAQAAAEILAATEARARKARRKRAAEAAEARKQARQGRAARPQDSPAGFSDSRRGIRRDKVFGPGRCVPLDRNAKVRVLIAADSKPVTITDLLQYCYPFTESFKMWHRTSIHRAVHKFAVEVGRRRSRGAPILWALKPPSHSRVI
jgi:hypothetical protein